MKLIMMATVSIIGISSAMAQQEGVKRTIISTRDFPAGYQTVKVMAEVAKGTCSGWHTHPGTETTYVLEGEQTFTVNGQSPKVYKPGDGWDLEPGVTHNGCATGDHAAKVLVTYVLEKGKPLATSVGQGTAEEAKAMLDKAIAAIKADREMALIQFVRGEGGFLDRDLYPFCSRISDGRTLASPRYVPAGMDLRTLKEPDGGKEYGKEILAAGQKPDGQLTEVHYKAPKFGTTSPLFPKVSFATKVGDLVCGVGYYQ
jgi:quercetin dioxygenase-like cupin family protein